MAVWNLFLLLNKSRVVFSVSSAQLWNHKIKKPEKAVEIRRHYISLHIWTTQVMAHRATPQREKMTFPRSQHSDFTGKQCPPVGLSWLLPEPLPPVPIKAGKGRVTVCNHPWPDSRTWERPFSMVCGKGGQRQRFISTLSFSEEPVRWQICWFVQSSSAVTCAKCGAFICPISFGCCFPMNPLQWALRMLKEL